MARSSNNSSFSPSWNFQWKEDLEFASPRPQIYIIFYELGSWRHGDLAAVKHCQRYHYESSDKPSIMDFSPRSCRMCPCHLRPIFQMVDFFSLCHSATNWLTNGFLTPTTWGPVSNAELDDLNFSLSQSSICIVGTTQQRTSGGTGSHLKSICDDCKSKPQDTSTNMEEICADSISGFKILKKRKSTDSEYYIIHTFNLVCQNLEREQKEESSVQRWRNIIIHRPQL